ncbi:AMP-binding protein [Glaciihabitans sp. INWT7]|uniref:AMP-binding protein n=1 Tax=Glaciihabitans sp. INWT7 TaxID=2596912 RepID=UPI001623E783|nr:AMP-binding protein [Glaciihabitans sp. INWT7]QNE45708.1 AMP-binding protein [Glaciihabitans sp. INWT7]
MTRPLHATAGDDPAAVFVALRDALAGGAAILPGTPRTGIPDTVDQRIAVVIETSGSTGVPKRVALSADALLASAAASESSLGGPGQWMLALPTHYIAGINVLVRSLASGFAPVYFGSGHFDAAEFAAASRALDAELRFTSLVPAQLARLVDAADDDLDLLSDVRRFDRILVGGQATPPALLARAIELGLNVTRTYGSSETSGGCVYDGTPIGTVEARVVDGQVELAGPVLAEGYLGDPAASDAAFVDHSGARWYRTGDTGEIIDGVLRVTGRLDSVIISGGEKVSLDAIERVVHAMPGLADAVAVRSPSAEWGEVPVIFTAAAATLAEVKSAVIAALGRASAPVALVRVESVPQLPNGKPDRRSLTAFAAARGGRPGAGR